jgi:hypothetical protein
LAIKEYQTEAQYESAPEDEEAEDEAPEAACRGKVGECLGAEEAGESVRFERTEDIVLLLVEKVGDEWGGVG